MGIIWTDYAILSLKVIYEYYSENANQKVANKIRDDIFKTTRLLIVHSEIGQIEPLLKELPIEYRYLLSGNYKIIYSIQDKNIIINDVFDTRQHPDKMWREE